MGSSVFPPPPPPPPPLPASPNSPANSKLPWVIAGLFALVAAVVVAVSTLSGGDEAATVAVTTTVAVAPDGTAAPTVITEPADTTSVTDPGVTVVNDDTGVFSVLLLDTFQIDTAPLTNEQGSFAQVSGATDLAAFQRDDDHETFGISVLVGKADTLQPPKALVTAFDPGVEVCADRSTKSGYQTLNGLAEVLLLDGCGTDGGFSKVVMAIDVPAQQSVNQLITQGPGPSNTDLLDFAQAVGESVVIQ